MHSDGLFLLLFGLYGVIRFRYNAKTSLKQRVKLSNTINRILFSRKSEEKISKYDILWAEIMCLIV